MGLVLVWAVALVYVCDQDQVAPTLKAFVRSDSPRPFPSRFLRFIPTLKAYEFVNAVDMLCVILQVLSAHVQLISSKGASGP